MTPAATANEALAKAILRKAPGLAEDVKEVELVVDEALKRLHIAKTRLKHAKKAYKKAKKAARKAKKVQRRWLAHITRVEAAHAASKGKGKPVAAKKAARKPKPAAKAAGPKDRSTSSTETVTPPGGPMG